MTNLEELKKQELEKKKPDTFSSTGNTAEVSKVTDKRIKTLKDLIKVCEIDLSEWIIERWVCNKWEVGAKNGDEVIVKPLFQVKAWLKRNTPAITMRDIKDEFVKSVSKHSFKYPKIKYSKSEPNAMEINIFDLHYGKLTWHEETGDDFDIHIAEETFNKTIDKMLPYAEIFNIEKIIFPVGNDFFNVDNKGNTTTMGTPQDEDNRWKKTFNKGWKMLVKNIDKCSAIAPVDVIVVAGNHDEERMFYLGEVLSGWYKNNPNVAVNNSAKNRKYYKYGKNLIGYTHGDKEKIEDLPTIMASEVPQDWADTKYREWHLGHIHHKREIKWLSTKEIKGITVRFMRSLSTNDAWHYQKGYIGQIRAGECFIWNKDNGLIGQFTACV